jgi:hypothetical protein
MAEIIGHGERATIQILKSIYGESAEYLTQVKFKDLLKGEWLDTVTERQEKETLDIVVKLPVKTIVVRVQDEHHNGDITAKRDLVQRKTLEWNDCAVVDLWYHDCPELWKDEVNETSKDEVITVLKSLGLYP